MKKYIVIIVCLIGLLFSSQSQAIQTAPVSEPATILLLGSVLVGFAGFTGRKYSKNNSNRKDFTLNQHVIKTGMRVAIKDIKT